MPKGQVFSIADGTGRLITTTTRNEVPDLYVLNPNDGVCYLKLNGPASIPDYDYKIPSQSYAGLPGPWISIGIYYVDQGGARAPGEISIYEGVADRHTVIPYFNAIGRAVPVGASSAMDIQQGNQPSNPPGGFTRLWSDTVGRVYRLLTGGDNAEFQMKPIVVADLPPLATIDHNSLGNLTAGDPHSQYVHNNNAAGEIMSGALDVQNYLTGNQVRSRGSITGNLDYADRSALEALGNLGPVDSNDFNTGHVSIQSPGGPARIGFHTHGVIGHCLYQNNNYTAPFRVISNAGHDVELITDLGNQTIQNKYCLNCVWIYPYGYLYDGSVAQYGWVYLCASASGNVYLPPAGGQAGKVITIKNLTGTVNQIYSQGGNIYTSGAVNPLAIYNGDSYTFLSDGGSWLVI